jgi:hypothetical protein
MVTTLQQEDYPDDLIWEGHASYDNILAVFSFLSHFVTINKANLSAKTVAHFANRLSQAGTLREFVGGLLSSGLESGYVPKRRSVSDTFYDYFGFLKSLEFSVPEALELVEDAISISGIKRHVDYEYYRSAIRNYFLKQGVREMEEDGVFLPLLWRFPSVEEYREKGSIDTRRVLESVDVPLADFERQLIDELIDYSL